MIPMETIPYPTTVTEYSPPSPQVATTAPAASAFRTTAPVLLPAEASTGTGTLSVVTSPAGAQVFVNDVLLGSSPATIPGLTAGSYNLCLEKSGYRKKTVRVDIGEGNITDYSTALEAESGGMGIIPIIAAVIIIGAGTGAAYWYVKRKKKPVIRDWNNP
jgi:hypothetical protein